MLSLRTVLRENSLSAHPAPRRLGAINSKEAAA